MNILNPVLAATDLLQGAFQGFQNRAGAMSDPTFFLLLRILAVLGISSLLVAILFIKCRNRLRPQALMAIEWAFAFYGAFLALHLPLDSLGFTASDRAWYTAFGFLGLLLLPWGLSYLLIQNAGRRRILAALMYVPIAFLFILNCFHR